MHHYCSVLTHSSILLVLTKSKFQSHSYCLRLHAHTHTTILRLVRECVGNKDCYLPQPNNGQASPTCTSQNQTIFRARFELAVNVFCLVWVFKITCTASPICAAQRYVDSKDN